MNKIQLFGLACSIILITGCASKPAAISEQLSPPELVKQAQAASDQNRYNRALQFYEAIIDRYPSYIDEICAAEYEIAFIHYKQKKYDRAAAEFSALLVRYDQPDAELLPQQFKRLAELGLQKIEAKQGKKKK